MGKGTAKKLVKVNLNGRTADKPEDVDWEMQALLWDESEPINDSRRISNNKGLPVQVVKCCIQSSIAFSYRV